MHLHRLPARPSRISVLVGRGFLRRKSTAAKTIPGVTKTALNSREFHERVLNHVQMLFRRKSLDGRDFTPLKLGSQHEAGESAFSVHEHGAGPAITRAAGLFRADQAHVLPQKVHDSATRGNVYMSCLSIEGEVYSQREASCFSSLCMAARTRSAVSGERNTLTPQASATALATAGRGPVVAISPTPFKPNGPVGS